MSTQQPNFGSEDFATTQAQWKDAQHTFKHLIANLLDANDAVSRAKRLCAGCGDAAFVWKYKSLETEEKRKKQMRYLYNNDPQLKLFLAQMERLRRDHLKWHLAAFGGRWRPFQMAAVGAHSRWSDTLPQDDIIESTPSWVPCADGCFNDCLDKTSTQTGSAVGDLVALREHFKRLQ